MNNMLCTNFYVIRYALSLDNTSLPCENPIQLTVPGYYHSVTVDTVC